MQLDYVSYYKYLYKYNDLIIGGLMLRERWNPYTKKWVVRERDLYTGSDEYYFLWDAEGMRLKLISLSEDRKKRVVGLYHLEDRIIIFFRYKGDHQQPICRVTLHFKDALNLEHPAVKEIQSQLQHNLDWLVWAKEQEYEEDSHNVKMTKETIESLTKFLERVK